MGYSQEEIKSGRIQLFDHLKDPSSRVDLITCLRLLQYIPLVEQSILDRLVNLLEEAKQFRFEKKSKLNKLDKQISEICNLVYKDMKLKSEYSTDDEGFQNMSFGLDMVDNLVDSLTKYMNRMEIITNVSETLTDDEKVNYIIQNCMFISKLKVGEKFLFVDTPNATEYTYIGRNNNGVGVESGNIDILCYYKKVATGVEFCERNIFRPVLPMNLIDEDVINKLREINGK